MHINLKFVDANCTHRTKNFILQELTQSCIILIKLKSMQYVRIYIKQFKAHLHIYHVYNIHKSLHSNIAFLLPNISDFIFHLILHSLHFIHR